MSLFAGPEYASYITLMRELRLERGWEDGDFFVDGRTPEGEPAIHGRLVSYAYEEAEFADEHAVWLPRLDQWLAMLEEAGVPELQVGPDYAQVETGRHGGESGSAPTREEALARLWCAMTGRATGCPYEAFNRDPDCEEQLGMSERVVRVWTFSNNGMVMAVDEAGEQVPEYQGRLEDVEERIRRDFPDAEWMEPFDFAEAARLARDALPRSG